MGKIHGLEIEDLPSEMTPDRLPREMFALPHFVLLESSLGGRYTIAAWEPAQVLVAENGRPFFDVFAKEWRKRPVIESDLPFSGGWIGYLGYELYSEIEAKVPPREPDLIPKAVMAFYDRFYLYDHRLQKAYLCSAATPPAGDSLRLLRNSVDSRAAGKASRPAKVRGRILSPPDHPHREYLVSAKRILDLIADGDCYQVNLSQRFSEPFDGGAHDLYERLRAASPSPYAAYLNLGDAQILSSSPESFLAIDGRRVTTRPIKGTRPRGDTDVEDAALKEELATSEKDRAELLMITDLERNDLGRVCEPGSVHVTELGRVETYPQVHHLVSTIEGTLEERRDVTDLLRAAFPGGSITGAPKVRAMQIIRELEPCARNVYCGAIGYVSLNGKSQFNVAIRTMILKNKMAYFWGGGGIVADSDPKKEYEETLTKVKGIFEALS